MIDMTDIAVVGGGLVGLMAAQCFAQSGCTVNHIYPDGAIDEQDDYPISLRPSSQELLESLGLWTQEAIISSMQTLHLSAVGYFGMLQLSRPKNETIADVVSAQRLLWHMKNQVKQEGGVITTNAKVIDIKSYSDHFVLVGETKSWRCRRLVIADGVGSPLARVLGVKARTYPKIMKSSVCRVQADGWSRGHGLIRKTAHTILGCIPRSQNEGWVIITRLASEIDEPKTKVSDLSKLIDNSLATRIGKLSSCEMISEKMSILQKRRISCQPGIICLGNSCMSTPPIGAQGLNMAIQDIATCQALQVSSNWATTESVAWQQQLQAICQPRHDRWYEKMALLINHLRNQGPISRFSEQAAWLLLGVSQRAERQLEAMGLGYG